MERATTSIESFYRRFGLAYALCFAAVLGPIALQTVRADGGSKSITTRPTVIATDPTVCDNPAQCDDADPCTEDRCTEGVCAYEAVPECIPCTIERNCPPVDIVFLMDTSGSMMDEAEVLCSAMSEVVSALGVEGTEVHASYLGITETLGGAFSCLTDDAVSLLGGAVPGDGASCPFPGTFSSHESWGPATAIVAERFPWASGALRIVVPLSDEGPCDGSFPDGCNNPGNDRDSIVNAANVAIAHGVVVSPITGTSSDVCVNTLAGDLAAMTGGTALQSQAPQADLADAIRMIVTSACETRNTCDDGHACTVNDVCLPTGGCVGTPIASVSCSVDADCFDSRCDVETGLCVCADRPELRLEVVTPLPSGAQCYGVEGEAEDDALVVDVILGHSVHQVIGGQFLIGYNPDALEFVASQSGNATDPDSPFSQVLSRILDDERGRFFYAVGATTEKLGTQGPAIMARLRFRRIGTCSSSELCFFDEDPMTTRLTDGTGSNVPFDASCSGLVPIAGEAPELICPVSRTLQADAGFLSATATWEPIEIIPGCDGPVAWSCTASHSLGAPVDDLTESGGAIPVGTARFDCTATEPRCGLQNSCSWSVTVDNTSLVEVDVELSSPMAPGPFDRCIEFEFLPNCLEAPFVIQAPVRFGLPFNFPGNARRVQFKIPAGEYTCVRARDPLHTLRSVAVVEVDGTKFVARFVGDPLLDGNWLVGGNVDGNGTIDVLDLATAMGQLGRVVAADTPCATPGPHADINGDGIVDQLDLDFIDRNLFEQDGASCCGDPRGDAPVTEVSVRTLRAMGLGHLGDPDINGDGKVNVDDLTALREGRLLNRAKTDYLHRDR